MSINVNDKNIGHATAYAYYKAGGGTMTEAEFTEFMADFGTASQTAVEAAQAALASKNAAQTAATTATNKATEATTAATTATTKAGEASTSASTATSAKDTAVSASQTATTKATEATTAAATATSAATTATTAKDDAVSAKTAAQTAQTGAETAAASVSASAEQIATNAADISQLKSDLSNLDDAVGFVPFDTIQGSGINASGVISSLSDSARTDYIPVSEGEKLYFTNAGSLAEYNVFYDSSKAFVSRFNIPASTTATPYSEITVPENAEYMIFSARNNNPLPDVWRFPSVSDETLKIKGKFADSHAVGEAIDLISQSVDMIETTVSVFDNGESVINANWANGTIEAATGDYTTSNANRIATVDKITTDRDYVLTIASGFRIYGYYFAQDGTISEKTGWTTGTLTIPNGTIFRATIARVTEISGEIADIYTFVSSVTMPTQIQTKINGLNSRVSALEDGDIPSYYIDHLTQKIQTIGQLDCTIGNHGDSFVFITDTHLPRNAGHSPALIKHILKNTSVNKVFNGGDTLDDNSTWLAAVETLRSWRNEMYGLEYRLIGNHDLNKINQSITEAYLDNDDFYGTMQKPFENAAVFDSGLYFYVDNTAQKIRYICVDINFPSGGGENTWLQNRLTELESGWTALVISHYLWGGSPSSGISTDGTRIIGAINNVYSQLQCDVIGILAGHTHVDKSDTESTNGYLLIATTTDAYGANQDTNVIRTVNTVSEQAFDVVHIDTSVRKLYMTRIGGGSDREFSY